MSLDTEYLVKSENKDLKKPQNLVKTFNPSWEMKIFFQLRHLLGELNRCLNLLTLILIFSKHN